MEYVIIVYSHVKYEWHANITFRANSIPMCIGSKQENAFLQVNDIKRLHLLKMCP